MWRKPPKLVEEAMRSLVVLGTLIIGFAALRMVTVGLSIIERSISILASLLISLVGFGFVAWNPWLRAEQRYAQALSEELPSDPKFTVRVALLKGETGYGQDTGVLRFEGGCLHFHGLSTSFSIPRSQVRLREDAEGKNADKITLLTVVDEEAIGIDFSTPGIKVIDQSLLESFGRFWNSASTGEFSPPPTSAQPRIWSGLRFPGWKQVVFWVVVYIFVIVQAFILQGRDLHAAQRVLAGGFIGTLAIALALEVVRFKRLMVEVERDIPKVIPSLLPVASSIPVLADATPHQTASR